MRIKAALLGFAVLTALYLGALVWLDARRQVFDGLVSLVSVLPVLVAISLATYGARYARWYWLLLRAGYRVPVCLGFLAYLAGFAFTATPGKVGELIRIRYFEPMGVPAWRVIAVFVFERGMDLLVVLGLAMLAIQDAHLLALSAGFVLLCLGLVVLLGRHPAVLHDLAYRLDGAGLRRTTSALRALARGLGGAAVWLRPADVMLSVLAGVLAWGATAFGFVYLLRHLGVTGLPLAESLAIYPLSMLAGAASMLPGGIGSTEATITALLHASGVPLEVGVMAAVGVRLATLWFAILCGLASAAVLEAGWPAERATTRA
ncbi:YbhN family protein [Burkholderiaceae bacterium UC74_6]